MKRVVFHRIAQSEMIESGLYLEERRPGTGDKFFGAVEDVKRLLSQYPEIGQPYEAGTRKFRLRGFPYTLIYKERSEEIFVFAVAHFSREPGYWLDRLTS